VLSGQVFTAYAAAGSTVGSPGRFGYDRAEHRLHVAEAHLTLEHFDRAADADRESIAAAPDETPAWVGPPSGPPP
jgi:hypothetical protein